MLIFGRSSRALRGGVVVLLAAGLAMADAASARVLTGIDRLGDAAPARAGAAAAALSAGQSEAIRLHSRLQVPTFLWGNRGGPVAPRLATVPPSPPSDAVAAARAYLQGLASLYTLRAGQMETLSAAATQDFANGAALVKFRNQLDGIEIFREEAAVLLSPERKLVAIGGFLMGGSATGAFDHSAAEAAAVALSDWSFESNIASALHPTGARDDYQYLDLSPDRSSSSDGSRLEAPLRMRRVYFRLPDQLVPAYYIEVQMRDGGQAGGVDYYAYVIAATDLAVLYRHSQVADASFAYRVFAENSGNNLPYPAPTGRNGFPSLTGVPDGYQAPFVTPNLVTLQNLPFSRNDPWLAPGATQTNGNNVNTFANLVMPDGFGPIDPAECNVAVAPTGGDFHACTSAASTFDYTHDPTLAPKANKTQVMAAVTNLFYLNNWLHDWYYDAGFDEVWGNAQARNFGRGGREDDVLLAQAQDASGTNNANMHTPSDGASPQMRMFVYEYRFAMVKLLAPAAIAGVKPAGVARFGAQAFDLTANVVSAVPPEGCSVLTNAAAVAGKIALIDLHGNPECDITIKVKNAQNAGASGALLTDKRSPVAGTVSGTDATITIPAGVIGSTDTLAIAGQPDDTVSVRMARVTGVDRDGSMANDIIAHEWGHFISNRLIANASGLGTNQAGGLGEGWADFHALLMLVKGTDAALPNNANFNGTYAPGGYPDSGPDLAPDLSNTVFYYGQRRYPYSRDLAKNPLTFRHIQDGVALPVVPAPFPVLGINNAEMHNTGEIWASMLWQCYSNLLNDTVRLTFAQAQDRMKHYLVAGYKMTPADPTFIEARDALLAVIGVQSSEDHALCMQGFAARGAGVGAVAPNRYSTTNAGVIESFGGLHINSVTLSDRPQYCDADGFLDNGETGLLTVTLENTGGIVLPASTGTVVSSNAHVQFPSGNTLTFPASRPGQQMSVTVPVAVVGATAREAADFTITVDNAGLRGGPAPVIANVLINVDQTAARSAMDDVESAHTVWRTDHVEPGPGHWQRGQIGASDHRWASSAPPAVSDEWLVSPPLEVAATGSFSFTFKHRHNFKHRRDTYYGGGILMISINGADFDPIPSAALTPPYGGKFDGLGEHPRDHLPAYVGTNASHPAQDTVTVNLGTVYQGKTVYIAFVSASNYAPVLGTWTGWEIDDISFSNITNTPFDLTAADAGACVSITPLTGTPQSAPVGAPFATSLRALVRNAHGVPLPGLPVTFSVPVAGASATLSGPGSVITDASGVATAPTLTANATPGTYGAVATAGRQATTFALTNAALNHLVSGAASPPAGGSVNCASPVAHGGTTSCNAVANASYALTWISGCGGVASSTSPYATGAVTAACTVSATFATGSIAVTGIATQGGSIVCASPVVPGNTTTCTVTPDPGRDIASISGCGGTPGTSNPYTTGPITLPCAVTVTFVGLPIPTLDRAWLTLLMLALTLVGAGALGRRPGG